MDYWKRFLEHDSKGRAYLAWIGQAGFLMRNSSGRILILDPYLSDLVEKVEGEKRLMMSLLDPGEFTPDIVLCSHEHLDHLDTDSLPVWIEGNVALYANMGSRDVLDELGLNSASCHFLKPGDEVDSSGFHIRAVPAYHGFSTPTALGYMLEFDGMRIYYTGDTSYQRVPMSEYGKERIDILIAPINGEYGNMNENDVAMLSRLIKPGMTIPCHFGTFVRHGGNPYLFRLAMKEMAPDCICSIMGQGEILDL